MAITVKQTEAIPASYPVVNTAGWKIVSDLNIAAVWQRIEAYTVHRFTSRAVEWVVEGPGEWCPPLRPAAIATVEIWTGTDWEAIAAIGSPLGYWLSNAGPYRFTGTIGGGDLPETVKEAFRRLCEYLSQARPDAGAGVRSRTASLGPITESVVVDATWAARALEASGAADLLRPYRRGV